MFVEHHNMGALDVLTSLFKCLVTTVLTHEVGEDPYVMEQTDSGMSHISILFLCTFLCSYL